VYFREFGPRETYCTHPDLLCTLGAVKCRKERRDDASVKEILMLMIQVGADPWDDSGFIERSSYFQN
jgi:hypothetical protein